MLSVHSPYVNSRGFSRFRTISNSLTDPRRGPMPGRIAGGAAHSRYRQVGQRGAAVASFGESPVSSKLMLASESDPVTPNLGASALTADIGPNDRQTGVRCGQSRTSASRVLGQHRADMPPIPAWKHVYRLLLWIDSTTGLAHCYESDKSQPGQALVRAVPAVSRLGVGIPRGWRPRLCDQKLTGSSSMRRGISLRARQPGQHERARGQRDADTRDAGAGARSRDWKTSF